MSNAKARYRRRRRNNDVIDKAHHAIQNSWFLYDRIRAINELFRRGVIEAPYFTSYLAAGFRLPQ